MAILVGTPNTRGLISTVHFQMVVQLMEYMRAKRPGMPVHHKVAACSMVGFARNALASWVLSDPQYSHLLLVDADISVPAETIDRMITFDKPVVACPYPTRDWDRQAFADAARKVEDVAVAEACAMTYVGGDDALVLQPGPDGPRPVMKGQFAKVKTCGAGVLLVKREALELVARKKPEIVLAQNRSDYWKIGFKGDKVLECFEHAADLRSDQAAEGAAFAKLWIEDCGGEIWTDLEATVVRYAEYRFAGHYASKLKLGLI